MTNFINATYLFLNTLYFVLFPKIVVCFSQKGCMGTIHKFQWIGICFGSDTKEYGIKIYKIKVIKGIDTSLGETRHAYNIQKIAKSLYVHYI